MKCLKGNLIDSYTYDEGNMGDYIDRLYANFCAEFIDNICYYKGRKIIVDKELASDGKLARFWHLITEGNEESLREPVYERAKRLHWIFQILNDPNCLENCPDFYSYELGNKGQITEYIICAKLKYLIVLRKMKYVYILKTAYPISEIKLNKQINKALEYKKKETP